MILLFNGEPLGGQGLNCMFTLALITPFKNEINSVCCVGSVRYKSKWIKGCYTANMYSEVWCFEHWLFVRKKPWSETLVVLSDEGPMLETLDFTIRIGSTPTFFHFDLYF